MLNNQSSQKWTHNPRNSSKHVCDSHENTCIGRGNVQMIDIIATEGKATKTDSKCHTNDSDKPVSGVARNNETYTLP